MEGAIIKIPRKSKATITKYHVEDPGDWTSLGQWKDFGKFQLLCGCQWVHEELLFLERSSLPEEFPGPEQELEPRNKQNKISWLLLYLQKTDAPNHYGPLSGHSLELWYQRPTSSIKHQNNSKALPWEQWSWPSSPTHGTGDLSHWDQTERWKQKRDLGVG